MVNGVDMIGFVTGAGFGAMVRCVEFSRVERSASVSILMVSSVFVLTWIYRSQVHVCLTLLARLISRHL